MSRTPVRAAIIRLENEGLVMRRNGRTIVQDFLGREMAEITGIRKSLERLAVVTACRSVEESDILRLKEINAEFGNALCVGNISKVRTQTNGSTRKYFALRAILCYCGCFTGWKNLRMDTGPERAVLEQTQSVRLSNMGES